ncbi:cytochrome b/b6 domain-containing protein [Paucibacter sp. B2R-40]|uniref:cytochrome b/b6 domain-containing protein n=1 Tax=Paucibacter sp. B2R-40 TaxID=2893554 RepID=UPI0021E3B2CE|nr:cytochrome b/b6 domain-containing protein [Paucibacter sp. B2R-40]MCV2355648.1 cytochrome b/b6 domain-containing protein [Paucibacter sp. B2R-40]
MNADSPYLSEVLAAQPAQSAPKPEAAQPLEVRPAVAVRLWDLPTRIFHWSLLLAVAVAITTGLIGGNWMDLHGQAGLSIVGLLTFRLVWGFVGNRHARFRNFVPSPQRLLAYLQGRWQGLGHNPLGALSVLALLGLLAAQAVTGLLGYDEIAFSGPLAALVSEETSLRLTGLHHQMSNALFVLIGLHIAAIALHGLLKKDNLVGPMLSGIKQVRSKNLQAQAAAPRSALASLASFSLALAVAAAATYLASGATLHAPTPASTALTDSSPAEPALQSRTAPPAAPAASAAVPGSW